RGLKWFGYAYNQSLSRAIRRLDIIYRPSFRTVSRAIINAFTLTLANCQIPTISSTLSPSTKPIRRHAAMDIEDTVDQCPVTAEDEDKELQERSDWEDNGLEQT